MPENIEPTNPEEAAEEIAALQEVEPEQDDVEAHSATTVEGGASSSVSVAACC